MDKHYPETTCGALIFDPSGRIFLMTSYKWKGAYVIPGGHIELGETVEDAVRRETKEETGLDVYDITFICFHNFIYGKQFWKKKHFIFLNFICKTKSTKATLNSEGQEYVWATPKEALKLPLEEYTRKTINIFTG